MLETEISRNVIISRSIQHDISGVYTLHKNHVTHIDDSIIQSWKNAVVIVGELPVKIKEFE